MSDVEQVPFDLKTWETGEWDVYTLRGQKIEDLVKYWSDGVFNSFNLILRRKPRTEALNEKAVQKAARLVKFDLDKALAGAKAYHITRELIVDNVTLVGKRVAFTIPGDGDAVYSCLLDGNRSDEPGVAVLMLVAPEPKRFTVWANVYPDGVAPYEYKANADHVAGKSLIATIPITIEIIDGKPRVMSSEEAAALEGGAE